VAFRQRPGRVRKIDLTKQASARLSVCGEPKKQAHSAALGPAAQPPYLGLGARAAGSDPGGWIPAQRVAERIGAICHRVPRWPEGPAMSKARTWRSNTAGQYDRLPALAAEPVRRQVAVIAANSRAASKGGDRDRLHSRARTRCCWTRRHPERPGGKAGVGTLLKFPIGEWSDWRGEAFCSVRARDPKVV
jgi:hypothetical protein